jgi:hypothetical protein
MKADKDDFYDISEGVLLKQWQAVAQLIHELNAGNNDYHNAGREHPRELTYWEELQDATMINVAKAAMCANMNMRAVKQWSVQVVGTQAKRPQALIGSELTELLNAIKKGLSEQELDRRERLTDDIVPMKTRICNDDPMNCRAGAVCRFFRLEEPRV